MLRDVRVQGADFSLGEEMDRLRRDLGGELGAVSVFCGLVRDHHRGAGVDGLFLEHFPGMTEESIDRILEQAAERWPLQAAVVIHRVGQLAPGDQIVLVMSAAAHREPTLEATAFIIDFLKTDAIFWKKETSGGATRWVESRKEDFARARDWKARSADSGRRD
jgi:molybdopterin synthase catalytic subunit